MGGTASAPLCTVYQVDMLRDCDDRIETAQRHVSYTGHPLDNNVVVTEPGPAITYGAFTGTNKTDREVLIGEVGETIVVLRGEEDASDCTVDDQMEQDDQKEFTSLAIDAMRECCAARTAIESPHADSVMINYTAAHKYHNCVDAFQRWKDVW